MLRIDTSMYDTACFAWLTQKVYRMANCLRCPPRSTWLKLAPGTRIGASGHDRHEANRRVPMGTLPHYETRT